MRVKIQARKCKRFECSEWRYHELADGCVVVLIWQVAR